MKSEPVSTTVVAGGPGFMLDGVADLKLGIGFSTETFWFTETVGLSTLVIVSVTTLFGAGTTAGAVYVMLPSGFDTAVPMVVFPPAIPFTVIVTALLLVPVTSSPR